jgi:N-acetylglucosamine kinase-like BadF-type ATPase
MTVEDATAFGHIEQAIDAAFRDAGLRRTRVASLCAAMAGSDREPIRQRIREWAIDRCVAHSVKVVHDAEPLLAQLDRPIDAVALIAGTGSFAFGRAADGRCARAGGWGPVLGDEGSAYWMGLEALRWLSRVVDGRAERTAMFDQLERSVAWGSQHDLAGRVGAMSRQSIAALAKLVDQSAGEGDRQATAICDSAANCLTEVVTAVVSQLELSRSGFALVVTGGVLLNRSMVFRRLEERLAEVGLVPSSISRCDDPAWGAVQIASSMQPE